MFRHSFSKNRQRFARSQNYRPNNKRGGNGKSTIHHSRYVRLADIQAVQSPPAITHKFDDFAIHPQIKRNITIKGYSVPTPIQDQAIKPILDGLDVVGIANTGTGKTAAFLIPLIHKIITNRNEKVLVIVPTRELAVQIEDELRAFSVNMQIFSALCIGGASMHGQMVRLSKNPNFVVATPGRLKDLIQRRQIYLARFGTIVLDEVDRMLDVGFVNEIKYIISLLPQKRQSLFFSATVSSEINAIIRSFTKNPITISVKVAETAQSINQDIIKVRDNNEKFTRLSGMLKQSEFSKVLIFGRTKWGVERLAKRLEQTGISAGSIHGNKSQNQRLQVLNKFKQNRLHVLVATDIAARGLDIDDVSHVINYDEPSTYDDYIHRIGRTGRANKKGKALTFVESHW